MYILLRHKPHKENYIINYTLDNYTNSSDYKLFI